ncbi:MAG: hypothetical protein ABH952_04845 [Candidatus Omnitrophota bacterium]
MKLLRSAVTGRKTILLVLALVDDRKMLTFSVYEDAASLAEGEIHCYAICG